MQLHKNIQKQFTATNITEFKKKLYLNKTYEINIGDSQYFDVIDYFIELLNTKNKIDIFPQQLGINLYSFLQYTISKKNNNNDNNNQCKICLEQFMQKNIEIQTEESSDLDLYILDCQHIFHKGCLLSHIVNPHFLRCPTCHKMNGLVFGNMPDGIMSSQIIKDMYCEGYEKQKYGTIVIEYQMYGGISDGMKYDGRIFKAYLPENGEGYQALFLLKEAFRRKLTFTVKKSGNDSKVYEIVWNGITHKTELKGGILGNGYPDTTYFGKVKEELRMRGLTM